MIFVLVFGLLALQVVLYALFYKRRVKWIDFTVFGFFLLGNAWLFPWLVNRFCHITVEGEMPDLLVMFAFWLIGLPATIILFIVYGQAREDDHRNFK